jgi:hypothetical protein
MSVRYSSPHIRTELLQIKQRILAGPDRGVRHKDDVAIAEGQQWIGWIGWLGVAYIETKTAKSARRQRLDQRALVDEIGSRDINEHGSGLHTAQLIETD